MAVPNLDGELVHAIVHAAADYVADSSGGKNKPEVATLTEKAKGMMEHLDQAQKESLLARLRIHQLMIVKDLRREVGIGQTETAALLQHVSQDTRLFLKQFTASIPDDVIDITREGVQSVLDPERTQTLTALAQKPGKLYEDVIGEFSDDAFEAAKRAVKPNAKKHIDLINPVFKDGKVVELVDAIGYVPQELYDANTFKDKVNFSHLAATHDILKTAEVNRRGIPRERLLQGRAQLLTQLFLSGISAKEELQGKEKLKPTGTVTVDTNGLWIKLELWAGKNKDKKRVAGLDAHLPYEYASEELLAAMVKQGFLSDTDVTEARQRRAEATNDLVAVAALEELKIQEFLRTTGMLERTREAREKGDIGRVAWDCFHHAECDDKTTHFPLSLIEHELDSSIYPSETRILGRAERIQRRIAKDTESESGGFNSYAITQSARDSYERRTAILDHPGNYDAARIAGKALEEFEKRKDRPQTFRLIRGVLREGTDRSHSFLEIVSDYGKVRRVLIDPSKHLTPVQREIFEKLPALNRNEFEFFETQALVYWHYSCVYNIIRQLAGARGFDMDSDTLANAVKHYCPEFNDFLLMEDPQNYDLAMRYYNDATQEKDYGALLEYDSLCWKAIQAFKDKVFADDPRELCRKLDTHIRRHEVKFDSAFLEQFPQRFKEKSWTSDPELCRQLGEIEQTIIVYDAGAEEMNYTTQGKAIRALRLLPDRPLICVIGGCRDIPTNGSPTNAMEQMCNGVVECADRLQANVIPPGTQSGIGAVFGRASVGYNQRTAALPPAQRARFFAVSPGGETYFPGNPHLASESEKEAVAYAIAPFDAIITPYQAGWDWTGERKKDAPYFRHVKYAEGIYERLSAGQPRVTVVGNGGLFTIVEAAAALEHDSAILLVEDTGRFADLAVALEKNRTEVSGIDLARWEARVLNIIETEAPEHSRELLLNEFGRNPAPDTPEERLYRTKLREYFVNGQGKNIRVTGVDRLQGDIDGAVDDWRSKHAEKK